MQPSTDSPPRQEVRKSGVRSQESGVRSQESGVRSQESGVRSQESGSLPSGFTLYTKIFCI
ncbi:hypothetical protein O998_01490 [Anaplasma phagocytophilum str. Norway variant1]|uniref:Uncharacterized protein n=1 Tax=Anaplasma phagocytophilum str. Norway variant1 TaxID=1392506 RepID=A0A7H9DYH2_ANAPH|nr:hypothetical protein [Anaplasma phagocytophilum]QLL66545.1 hypothetical protein O998_01490 [Anaplasma phagocytophilum str. Norway variant1]